MKDILTMAREAGIEPHSYDESASLAAFANLIRADAVPPGYVVVPAGPVAQFKSDAEFGHVDLLVHRGEPMRDGALLYTSPPDHIEALRDALEALILMRHNGIKVDEWDTKAIESFDATIASIREQLGETKLNQYQHGLSAHTRTSGAKKRRRICRLKLMPCARGARIWSGMLRPSSCHQY